MSDSVPDYGDEGRKYWIGEGGSMMRALCESNMRELSYFLRTIDKFITDGEHSETEEIVKRYKGQPVDWSDEHPWWWQGVLGVQLRQSLVDSIMSATENHVRDLCESVQSICELPLSQRHLTGSWIERSRRFLIKLAEFSAPNPSSWEQLGAIYSLRNLIVHNGGLPLESGKVAKLVALRRHAPGISIDGPFVAIEIEFCDYAHEVVTTFFEQLHEQYQDRCRELAGEIA